jgi:hypothetical protein
MSKRNKNPYRDHPILGKHPEWTPTTDETLALLAALFKHHGIPDPKNDDDLFNAFGNLALCLAEEFVPAFQPRKSPGRRREWSASDSLGVIEEYSRLKTASPSLSDNDIFAQMAEYEIYKKRRKTAAAIRDIYNRAKKAKANFLLRSAVLERLPKLLNEKTSQKKD